MCTVGLFVQCAGVCDYAVDNGRRQAVRGVWEAQCTTYSVAKLDCDHKLWLCNNTKRQHLLQSSSDSRNGVLRN